MKTYSLFTCSLLLLLLLVTSCHPGVVVDLFNNSGQDLTVVTINQGFEDTIYHVKKGRILRIGVSAKLRIEHLNENWNYERMAIPQQFWKRENFMISVINLQIEKDGMIYMLLPDARGLQANLPPQPTGYPLKPETAVQNFRSSSN